LQPADVYTVLLGLTDADSSLVTALAVLLVLANQQAMDSSDLSV
jgi:hypothetical protein